MNMNHNHKTLLYALIHIPDYASVIHISCFEKILGLGNLFRMVFKTLLTQGATYIRR